MHQYTRRSRAGLARRSLASRSAKYTISSDAAKVKQRKKLKQHTQRAKGKEIRICIPYDLYDLIKQIMPEWFIIIRIVI